MQILFLIFMFVVGAVFGSYLCCQARRLKLREKGKRRRRRSNSDPSGVVSGGVSGAPGKWSICFHCHKKLNWYDNIPIFSWLLLRGKCRFCHKKIGVAEFISEIATATTLTLIGTTINIETTSLYEWPIFVFMIVLTLIFVFIAIYDGLYGEMPMILLTFSIICAIIIVILQVGHSFLVAGFFDGTAASVSEIPSETWFEALRPLLDAVLAAALYGGIYLILYLVSKGKWVGDGDWLLGLAIGLAIGSPWLAFVSLFLANFSACLVMLPFMKKNHQIYFGPFMVFAFVVTYVLAPNIIEILSI